MNPKIQAVLFDFDGTIVDTGRGIMRCVRQSLECFGISEPDNERLRFFIGPPLIDSYMQLYGVNEATGNRLVDKYREFYSGGGLFESDLYPGVEEMLSRLSGQGRVLAIASSKPEPFVRKLTEHLKIDSFFSLVSAPPIGRINPPKSELISSALTRLEVCAENAAMVGDRLFDIQGGKAAGTLCVGAAYGYGGEKELHECGADLIAHSPIEIAELVENYESIC